MNLKLIHFEILLGFDTIKREARSFYGDKMTYNFGILLDTNLKNTIQDNPIQRSINIMMIIQFHQDFKNNIKYYIDLGNGIKARNPFPTGNIV